VTSKPERSLIWMGSSKKDLMGMPADIRRFFGHALHLPRIIHSRLKVAEALAKEI
jgi:phage-related protein